MYDPVQLRISFFEPGVESAEQFEIHREVNIQREGWSELIAAGSFYPVQFFVRQDGQFLLGSADPVSERSRDEPRQVHYYLFDESGILISDKIIDHRAYDYLVDDENRIWVSTIIDDDEEREWWVLEFRSDKLLADKGQFVGGDKP